MFMQPLFQWKNNEYYILWVCVCSLSYPACNAHAPYCHLWPVRLDNIFQHYLINCTIKKKVTEHTMCLFIFSMSFVWNISHSEKNWARYDKKCMLVFMLSTCILVQFQWNLNFLNRLSKNTQISNLLKISLMGAELFHVDRQTEMMNLVIIFCNFVINVSNN
jgi:hypothetical protein